MEVYSSDSQMKIKNNLRKTMFANETSMERLSSGKRINHASDDAAGLAISERMKKTISSMNMASKNIDDGISLMKTGEGALSSIEEQLQRVRELGLQMQNGTYNANDQAGAQIEINQLLSSINGVANTTNFNGKNILNQDLSLSLGGLTSADYVKIPSQPQYNFGTGEFSYSVKFNLNTLTGTNQILCKRAGGGGNFEIQVNNGGSLTVFLGDSTGTSSFSTTGIQTGQWYEATVSRKFNPTTGKMEASLYVNGVLKAKINDTHNVNSTNELDFGQDSASKTENTNGSIKDMRLYNRGLSATETLNMYNGNVTRDGLVGEWLFNEGNGNTIEDTSSYGNNGKMLGKSVSWNNTINIHTGADATDVYKFSLPSVTISSLGINNLQISDNEFIQKVDSAIDQVSNARSKIGSLENSLQYNKEYNETSNIQLKQSNSRIEDADLANEMSTVTKNKIVINSTISIMIQDNQNKESFLQLLN